MEVIKNCRHCNGPLSKPDQKIYCSRSCAATVNGSSYTKRNKKIKLCACGSHVTRENKWCDNCISNNAHLRTKKLNEQSERQNASIESDPTPFKGLLIRGPYTRKSQRRYINFQNPITGKGTSMSYARYLICLSENRLLTDQEVVDHIDGNPLNDALNNLRILTPSENSRLAKKQKGITRTVVTLVCPVCNITFEREKRNSHLAPCRKQIASVCSRVCGGKWSNEKIRNEILGKQK